MRGHVLSGHLAGSDTDPGLVLNFGEGADHAGLSGCRNNIKVFDSPGPVRRFGGRPWNFSGKPFIKENELWSEGSNARARP
jgi:hypothetical protein